MSKGLEHPIVMMDSPSHLILTLGGFLLQSWNQDFPFCLKVVDGSEGRELQLINRKSLRLLTSQMLDLLMSQEDGQVASGFRVDMLSERYCIVHGVPLNPCEYGFLSLSELLKSLPYLVEVRGCFSSPTFFNFKVPQAEADLSSSTVVS